MNDRSSILNIKPVDPFNPQPVIIKLRFAEPKQVEGKFGPQFMYGVEVDGESYTLFASKALDTAIYETGTQQGGYVAIIRTGEGKDTRWQARACDIDGNPVTHQPRKITSAPSAPRVSSQEPRQQPSPAAPATKPQPSHEDRLAAFLEDENLYFSAMARAKTMLGDAAVNIDLNAVSFVLYKMAKEHGIELDATGDPVLPYSDDEKEPF
jgi:hypothetical protein